jgi:hypothetical protein
MTLARLAKRRRRKTFAIVGGELEVAPDAGREGGDQRH